MFIKFLMGHGADPDYKNNRGDSAMQLAKCKKIEDLLNPGVEIKGSTD